MPGDYSRSTFDQRKHYSGVLMQQGRVQLDADWNEQLDIQLYRTETEAQDVIGLCGVPKNSDGFKIGITPDGNDLTIAPGRFYARGRLCELELTTTYGTQPDLPNPEFTISIATSPLSPPASPPSDAAERTQLMLKPGIYIVYIDVSQPEITARDDPRIREVALGGPDTTTRLKNVWQVKLLPVSEALTSPPGRDVTCKTEFKEWNELIGAGTGKLNARTKISEDEKNPCLLPPNAGYSRLENQLYRVEIHKGGKTRDEARFKWSRDNGTVETTIEKVDGKDVIVSDIGKDDVLGFAGGQWVEIIERESELKNAPHPLVQIEAIQPETRTITLKTSAAAFAKKTGLKLRRWDQSENAAEDGVKITQGWLNLEGGIEVLFSQGSYRPGDYWLIPARTATGEIEWPPFEIPNTAPIAQPPAGIRHHFCRLALIEARTVSSPPASPPVVGLTVLQDCREEFPPLTGICAEDVCFDNSVCNLGGAETVQEALDQLCSSRNGTGCEITIGEKGQIKQLNSESLERLLAEFEGHVCLCFLPGNHVIDDLELSGQGRLSIHGCGLASSVQVRRQVALNGFVSLEISALHVDADPGCGFTFGKCNEVRVTEIDAVAADATQQPFLRFINVRAIIINGNRIHTKPPGLAVVPGLAIVFEDAEAITHFTENEIEGIVSFYGIPGQGQALPISELARRLSIATTQLEGRRGRLFMSDNSLQLLSIGRAKVDELIQFAQGNIDVVSGLYLAATLTGNQIAEDGNLFVSVRLTVSSCTLLKEPPQGGLYGTFVTERATAVGILSPNPDEIVTLAIVTRPQQFNAAGNLVAIKNP